MPPLWTLFTTFLTLLGLAAPGGARFCSHDQRPPRMIAWKSREINSELTYLPYGETITLICSSRSSSSLIIKEDDRRLEAELLNLTAIQVSVNMPDVGRYRYHCTDSNTNCSHLMEVIVIPDLSVVAEGVRRTLQGAHFVTPGTTFSVLCSADTTDSLCFEEDLGNGNTIPMPTNTLNESTVSVTVANATKGGIYSCFKCERRSVLPVIEIVVDYLPQAKDFWCIVYLYFFKFGNCKLQCSWSSSSEKNTFKLFWSPPHRSLLLCSDSSGRRAGSCTSTLDEKMFSSIYRYTNFSLQLQNCNELVCNNQTFSYNINSIMKLEPVADLELVNSSEHGAAVVWRELTPSGYCVYRAEYRLLGRDWRPVNVSSVRCDDSVKTCELQLPLPCPGAHYELRVNVRSAQATEAIYWSEPTTLFFFTAYNSDGDVDPACGADFREVTEKPPLSATDLLYEVRQLVSDERKEKRALRKHISDLNMKLAELKALMSAQK